MEELKYLQRITLATELDTKVAFAEIKIGDVAIKGITVWRSPKGTIRVFFPSQRMGNVWEDTVNLPAETLANVEVEVIAAYRKHKKELENKIATKIRE